MFNHARDRFAFPCAGYHFPTVIFYREKSRFLPDGIAYLAAAYLLKQTDGSIASMFLFDDGTVDMHFVV